MNVNFIHRTLEFPTNLFDCVFLVVLFCLVKVFVFLFFYSRMMFCSTGERMSARRKEQEKTEERKIYKKSDYHLVYDG